MTKSENVVSLHRCLILNKTTITNQETITTLKQTAMNATKKEEFTKVQRVSDGKYNFLDANGKILSDTWFYWVGYFSDGLALVQREDGLKNFIDRQGKLLSDKWYRYLTNFKDGFALIERDNGEWAKIDKNGKIVSE